MAFQHFQFRFNTSKNSSEVFIYLLNPQNWWKGLYSEIIEGKSNELNDIFSFKAGDGVHYSSHQLTELEADKKITWEVLESRLTFLENPNEWAGTKFGFTLEKDSNKTLVTFHHYGLVAGIECYDQCTNAWTQYLRNLEKSLS